MSQQARHAIGIDLGTTNCALASAPLGEEPGSGPVEPVQSLDIAQTVAPGEVARRPLLPSFLYFPSESEFPRDALALPWYGSARDVVGRFARNHGAATPSRLVSSAKSWLSHAQVDRRAAILPWQAPEGTPQISPLDASARFLGHLRAAWDDAHPEEPLAGQLVVLTVPASFDAAARELTLEAASRAGFDEVPVLLEEPQAALYDWVAQRGEAWRKELGVGDSILVIDIGGGTTDFSLIAVGDNDGVVELERVAVGDHILLGGDNMDLALAHGVRAQLKADGHNIDDWQMRSLTHACRDAKEALLADTSIDEIPVAIASRGSKLLGSTLRTKVERSLLEQIVLEGFFPKATADDSPRAARRSGLTTLGLPYASDAAITRHLAAFLRRAGNGGDMARPTTILFNGGVSRAPAIRERLLGILSEWHTAADLPAPRVLSGEDADLAVSRGASHYARVRAEGGLRIRGGTARSVYIGIERAELAIPGIEAQLDAICIAPAGMEEGSEVQLDEDFGLVLGEPVSFRCFHSADRRDDTLGTVVDPEELDEMPAIETTVEGEDQRVVQVRLLAHVTEVGTLDLYAVEQAGDPASDEPGQRWRFSFDLRPTESA